jgi:ribose/xylose/arabinose/galactoside ABC-type transport system permease subunit
MGTTGRPLAARAADWVVNNMVLLGLAFLVVFFSLRNPLFFSVGNARSILRQLAPIGIYSFPVALLLISRSIDLSLGAVVGLSSVIGIEVMNAAGIAAGLAAFLAVGLAAGVLNGLLVSYARLNPIIVTLGTQIVFRGLSLSVSGGKAGVPPALFLKVFRFEVLGFRPEVFVMIAVLALCWWLLHTSRFGRSLYASGENARVAFLMGVNVRQLQFLMHCAVGLTGGVVAIVSVSKLGLSGGGIGESMTLPVIIAVLLGGIDFGGGVGRIPGVIVGVFFIGVLEAGLLILGVTEFVQQVIVGAVLIAAIYSSTLRRRRMRPS